MIEVKGKKKGKKLPRRSTRTVRRRKTVHPKPEAEPKTPAAPAIPEPLPAEQTKEVRMRLDTNDRRLLVAGLLQLLPAKLRKDRDAWFNLEWEQRAKWNRIRELLERMREAQRGHPRTWF